MSGYFLHAREKRGIQKLKLAMSVGNSNHYHFDKIVKRHYQETAAKCLISKEDFERICAEIKMSFDKFDYKTSTLDPNLEIETLEMIVEGMKKRAARILV